MSSMRDIKAKIEAGNTLETQLLSASATPDDIAQHLVAFANSVGGTLIITLDSIHSTDNDNDTTLSSATTVIENIIEAATRITPTLMIPMPHQHEISNQAMVVAMVPEGLPGIYAHNGLYLQRNATASNIPLNPVALRHLMLERSDMRFEATVPYHATLDDLDWVKAEDYARHIHGKKDADIKTILHQRGCLTKVDQGFLPTYAGILLFGKNPRQYALGAEVTAVRFAGNTMSDKFSRQDIHGTLIDQVKQVETFLYDHLRKNVQLTTSMARDEHYEYPMEATRELIINAIAHRDYSIMGDTIRVYIYADRFEVSSPGTLAGPMTIDNIQHARFSRNPAIVQVLSDMHYIERLGYGVDRVLELMASQNLPAPTFEEVAGTFRVTLHRHQQTENTLAETPKTIAEDTRLENESPPSLVKDGTYQGVSVNARQEAAIIYLHSTQNNRISNSDLKAMFPDVHPETIRRDLVSLVNQGILLKMGQKRGSYYILAPEDTIKAQ